MSEFNDYLEFDYPTCMFNTLNWLITNKTKDMLVSRLDAASGKMV